MEALLRELMDRGFLIYRYDTDPPMSSSMDRPKFVLKKIRTPADSRPFDLGDGDDTLIEYFASFEEALDKAKKMIDWKEEDKEEVEVRMPKHSWIPQLMYRHVVRGPQFADLDEACDLSYEDAVAKAKKLAEIYITKHFDENEIYGWEVRVRLDEK